MSFSECNLDIGQSLRLTSSYLTVPNQEVTAGHGLSNWQLDLPDMGANHVVSRYFEVLDISHWQ